MKNTKENKLKELKKFEARIEKTYFTEDIEIYAKDKDDAKEIFSEIAKSLWESEFDYSENEIYDVQEIQKDAQRSFTSSAQKRADDENEYYYTRKTTEEDL